MLLRLPEQFCTHLDGATMVCLVLRRRVLVQEWVEGEKGPWKEDGEKLLTIGLQCSVLQVLDSGKELMCFFTPCLCIACFTFRLPSYCVIPNLREFMVSPQWFEIIYRSNLLNTGDVHEE